jgi:hypothetical protein
LFNNKSSIPTDNFFLLHPTLLHPTTKKSYLGATETHGCGKFISSYCATACWPCSVICLCCWLTKLMDKQMADKQITTHPGPCGDAKCCGAYWQLCLPCTAICTVCMMYREATPKA